MEKKNKCQSKNKKKKKKWGQQEVLWEHGSQEVRAQHLQVQEGPSRHLECESLVRFSPASPGQWMLKSEAAGSGGVGGKSLLGCPRRGEDAVSASAVGLVRKVSGRLECWKALPVN